jgi:hypothetical protein
LLDGIFDLHEKLQRTPESSDWGFNRRAPTVDDLRAVGELAFDLRRAQQKLDAAHRWDELDRRREARAIAIETALGWVRVARRLVLLLMAAAVAILAATGHLSVHEVLTLIHA